MISTFRYNMFKKSYQAWDNCCMYEDKDGTKKEITLQILVDTLGDVSKSVSTSSVAITWLCFIMLVTQIWEYLMLFMHKNEALSKKNLDI